MARILELIELREKLKIKTAMREETIRAPRIKLDGDN